MKNAKLNISRRSSISLKRMRRGRLTRAGSMIALLLACAPSVCRASGPTLTINPTSVTGGTSATGTLFLSAPAPPGGTAVQLASSDSTYAWPPSSVTVPAGQISQTFMINTAVWYTQGESQAKPVTIYSLSPSASAVLQVYSTVGSGPTLASLTLNPTSVVGGNTSTVTATLSGPAPPSGASVSLSTASAYATVPPSLYIPGGVTSASGTVNTAIVTSTQTATITGTYGTGPPRSANLTINPTGCQVAVSIVAPSNPMLKNRAGTFTATVSNPQGRTLSYSWAFGDGTTSTLASPPKTYTAIKLVSGKIAPYQVTLTITDINDPTCTASASTNVTVVAGLDRVKSPGFGDSCGGPDPFTGNADVVIPDPVATRGYPLTNNIHVNTQFVETNRLLGQATFTYDIHIISEVTGLDGVYAHWLLVDGNGRRHDFGRTTNPAPVAEAGVFSTLVKNGDNTWALKNAGPPEAIHEFGNFRYEFNASRQLTRIVDPAGNAQSLTYSNGWLSNIHADYTLKDISVFRGSGYVTFTHKDSGLAVGGVTVGLSGSRVTYVNVTDASANTLTSWQFTYDALGLIKTWTRDNDQATKVTYDYTLWPSRSTNYLTVALANRSDAMGQTRFEWGYDPEGGAADTVRATNNKGGVFRFDFNSLGDIVKETTPILSGAAAPSVFTFGYNAARRVTSVSDGAHSILLDYDTKGQLSSVNDEGRIWTWTYRYNADGSSDLQSAGDPLTGSLFSVGYDTQLTHMPVSLTDALSNTWNFTLEQSGQITFGQIKTVTPPAGSTLGTLNVVYNEDPGSAFWGYPLSMSLVSQAGTTDLVTFDGYTGLGDLQVFSTYPINGDVNTKNTTQTIYDAAQRLTSLVQPNGKTAYWNYPAGSRNLSYTRDENYSATTNTQFNYQYCPACGSLEHVDGPYGWSLNWLYNGDGDLTRFTDARGNHTYYRYGCAGEVLGLTFPDSTATSMSYDSRGRVSQFVSGRGYTFNVGYDASNRVTSVNGIANLTLGYNTDDTLQYFNNNVANISHEYFADGSIKTVTYNFSPWGFQRQQTVHYTYNSDGSRATMTWKDSGNVVCAWNYTYDQAGRLKSVSNSYNETTNWFYDGEGKLTSQQNAANGTWNSYFYDGDAGKRGWVSSKGSFFGASYFAAYELTYDGGWPNGPNTVGNLTGVLEGTAPRSFTGTTTFTGFSPRQGPGRTPMRIPSVMTLQETGRPSTALRTRLMPRIS